MGKTNLKRLISSSTTTIVLLLVYGIGLAAATFIEKYQGSEVARSMVYCSPLFFLLQFLLVLNWLAVAIRQHSLKMRKWGMLVTHGAFIIILLGALVSHLYGEEGILHLREGETSNRFAVRHTGGVTYHTLPFSVELMNFTLTRYPGSSSPSAYESELLVHMGEEVISGRVYMNNVLDVKGYRFFQASYDQDEQGTVLSVNRDVAGRTITYTGYAVLLLGLVLCFVDKRSRFMQLGRRLKELRCAVLLILSVLSSLSVHANDTSTQVANDTSTQAKEVTQATEAVLKNVINVGHAARFGALPLQSGKGRVLPVNTFSSEVLRKLHKSDTFGSLNSDQFLISVLVMPELWTQVPFIAVPGKELSDFYHLPSPQCAYMDVFDADGNYKLQEKLEEAYGRMAASRTRFDKELIKFDEQINIFHQLLNWQLLNLFPKEDDPQHTWYAPGDDLSAFSGKDSMFVSRILTWYVEEVQTSFQSGDWTKPDEIAGMISTYQQAKNKIEGVTPEKMASEIKYNRLDVFSQCKKGYLIFGGLLLVSAFASLFKRIRWIRLSGWALCVAILAVFFFHMYGMGMRWYIAGYAPWSNSYETMVYVSWATVFAGLLFARRSLLTFALATLFGGTILFVSGLNWMDPQINPLVPVLKSPWLMFHVAVIVGAYGFFGISCLLGLVNLVMMSLKKPVLIQRIKELSIINEMSLLIGLALMTIGTFLGAIWANESWGRYWGWDPKETWALITMVVYAIVTHLHLMPFRNKLWLFNLSSVIAFYSVLMTFFGVNYFLSGMHSYGQNDHVGGIFIYLFASVFLVALLGILSFMGKQKQNN